VAPSRAMTTAVPRPIPEVPPVTMIVFPERIPVPIEVLSSSPDATCGMLLQ
jgi:hypothetical protein